MPLASTYFQEIHDNIFSPPNHSDELNSCIETIAKYLGISINLDDFQSFKQLQIESLEHDGECLGIQFQRISLSSTNIDAHLIYPLLIQFKDTDEFKIFLPGKKPGKNGCDSNFNKLCDDSVKIWQCCPVNSFLPSSLHDVVIQVIRCFKRDLFRSLLVAVFFSFSILIISLLFGYMFSEIYLVNKDIRNYVVYLSIVFFILSSIVLNYISELYFNLLNNKINTRILPSFWNRLLNLPLNSIKKFSSADLVQRIMDYEYSVSNVVTNLLALIVSFFTIIFLLGYMMYCNFSLTLAYLIIYIIFLGLKIQFLQKSSKLSHDYLVSQGKIASILSEGFLQIDKIRSSNAESSLFRRWLKELIAGKTHLEKSVNLDITMWLLDSICPVLLIVLFYIYMLVHIKTFDTYYCLQLMICIGQLSFWFEKFSADMLGLINYLPAINRIFPIVNQPVEKKSLKMRSDYLAGEIKLINVALKKPGAEASLLENICMTINPGSFVALVGPSGAGKSSIFKLLLGFDQSYSGLICVDGIDIKNIDVRWMRKQFGVVLQSSNIFPGTIFSNISVNTNMTLDDAWRLARLVGLDNEVSSMPMKMFTHVSDNAGESISGGQRQKILIARALATHPKILLLDEATSSLDNASQALIFNNLRSLNITRFVIAHRYSTVVDADMIYVLNNGKIVDSGSFHKLNLLSH